MVGSDIFLVSMFVLVAFAFFCIGRIDGYSRGADSMRRSYRKAAMRKEQRP